MNVSGERGCDESPVSDGVELEDDEGEEADVRYAARVRADAALCAPSMRSVNSLGDSCPAADPKDTEDGASSLTVCQLSLPGHRASSKPFLT